MIRTYREADIDQVLDIWLSASIKAHGFVDPEFWESKVDEMRDRYIPASETFVYERNDRVVGFYSLFEDTLAAIFVDPDLQGQGIGAALLDDAKGRREELRLTVYRENAPSVRFYEKHGFIPLGDQVDENTGHAEIVMRYRV
ncbi:N-acetyltransferase [Halomonas elongata]|uniref:GNAT family acetyltransferase n=1 Tax=Halomonas elongata (strain ATCC 33173 / DSM 2581 / NBRC 15536 / NCIMB 2198 / 1H9) TaxID=768066 RepID=E1V3Z9_HALED|nr:N-acetyltransferase [Halomonas elongata]WBF16568.1 N-acetyltransferase [Halomonas elongata]WPU49009.1 N-acetyltransferase [Halomonas elongata DSM 2581]CBV42828.1 GNAT family acetyltransferase [Halomonas elongata DSM 2581]